MSTTPTVHIRPQYERIMHLRRIDYVADNKWEPKTRGITVLAKITENENPEVSYQWAIQNPTDQYSKKEGVRVASQQQWLLSQYVPGKSLMVQFFNALAEEIVRECEREVASEKSIEWSDRVNLAFDALLDISSHNGWFEADLNALPNIHPLILYNYMTRNSDLLIAGI